MSMDVHELRVIGSTAGEYNECVLHFQNTLSSSATPEADSLDLINNWVTSCQPSWLAMLASDYTLGGLRAKRVNNTGGPSAISLASPGSVGTVTGGSAPDQSAQLLVGDYYDAGASKPSWRAGRIFIPSVPESGYTAPHYTGAQQTLQNALVTALNAGFGSGTPGPWSTGVWSRKETTFYTVAWEVSLLIGTIRKRLHPVL